jgi:hypothetical protein
MATSDKRTFHIYIAQTYWIKEKGAPPHSGKFAKCDGDFANFRAQRGKIAEIFDIYAPVDKKELERLSRDQRFRERCHFIALNAYKDDELLAEFDGDFIDALNYVNENFYRLQREFG